MLKKLISGQESPDLILVEDRLERPGFDLLKAFIVSLADRVDVVHIYLYEFPAAQFTCDLPSNVLTKLSIEDMTGDPFGWNGGPASLDKLPPKPTVNVGQKAALVIDSISRLVEAKSFSPVSSMLHQYARRPDCDAAAATDARCGRLEQIVTVLHDDLHDSATRRALEYTASCVLKLGRTENDESKCSIVLKHAHGKIGRSDERFSISDSYVVTIVNNAATISTTPSSTATKSSAPDPTANLTFRLTLSRDEESARRNVVLPYLSARENEINAGVNAKQGQITYDVDDMDEEDPDDDLDI